MSKLLTCICLLLLWTLPAWAGDALTARYQNVVTGGVYHITTPDDRRARIDLDLTDFYYLWDDGILWGLRPGDGGWHISDYAELLQKFMDDGDPRLPHGDIGFNDTGRTEEVGGHIGRVFEITDNRARVTYEAVLTEDPEIYRVSQIMMLLYSNPNVAPGRRGVLDHINHATGKKYGVLRLGDLLLFEGLGHTDYDEAFFTLPTNLIS